MRKVAYIILLLLTLGAKAQEQETLKERVHFAWGAEAGSSIDMSGHDMSSIDFNASFGMKWKWIKFLGAGAGANIMVSNSCRSYPIYLAFKSDFTQKPSLLFADLRGGISQNYLTGNYSQTGAYASAAVGVRLSYKKTFMSYLSAGYSFIGREDAEIDNHFTEFPSLHFATFRLGITF